MSKHVEKLKNQLAELASVVNTFQSEAVQIRIIDRLLQLMQWENETAILLLKSALQVYPNGKNPKIEAPKSLVPLNC